MFYDSELQPVENTFYYRDILFLARHRIKQHISFLSANILARQKTRAFCKMELLFIAVPWKP